MGKTYKDRKVRVIEEKGYSPKVLKEEYKRERKPFKEILGDWYKENDTDKVSDERAE